MNRPPLTEAEIHDTAVLLGQLHETTQRMGQNATTNIRAQDAMSMAKHLLTASSRIRTRAPRFEAGIYMSEMDGDPGWQALGVLYALQALIDEPDLLVEMAARCHRELREALLP